MSVGKGEGTEIIYITHYSIIWNTMTLIIKCHRCGFTLYKGSEIVTPYEVLKRYGFRCPKCITHLSETPREILIEKRSLARRVRRRIPLF
ncbi:MAG: hypothetical protein DRJ47_02870 [Thermoprotei archaeon]|nr:MAG: hypothetical protein DRJ47_02870 [Thermoprotei archaeon]